MSLSPCFSGSVCSLWSPVDTWSLSLLLSLLEKSAACVVSHSLLYENHSFRGDVFLLIKIHDLNVSLAQSLLVSFLPFLSTYSPPWRRRQTLVMLSFSACFSSLSTPRLSLYPAFSFLSFFHLSPYFLSPSAPVLFQWASNWGSVIGREKRLGEKWKAVEGEKKRRGDNEKLDLDLSYNQYSPHLNQAQLSINKNWWTALKHEQSSHGVFQCSLWVNLCSLRYF